MTTIQGVIRGKTIELEFESGLPDGQAVAVTIQRIAIGESEDHAGSLPKVESWQHRIVFDSGVSPTEKVVKGTRLFAETLVAELRQINRPEELLTSHPELTVDDLNALAEYARTPVGLRRSYGAWAEDSDSLDDYLAWTRQQRKISRREIEG